MRFPPFDDRGTLTTIELEALWSLHGAYMTARYEWQSTVAIWDRLYTALDLTEMRAQERPPLRYYEEALHELGNGAHEYERHAALITWRYAASAAVLGITVLERVARAKPSADGVRRERAVPGANPWRAARGVVGAGGRLPARPRAQLR